MSIRIAEHMRDIRNLKDTSGPYIHVHNNPSHHFDTNNARLIGREGKIFQRKFKESIYIEKSSSYNCNLEKGVHINPIWPAAIAKFFKSPLMFRCQN